MSGLWSLMTIDPWTGWRGQGSLCNDLHSKVLLWLGGEQERVGSYSDSNKQRGISMGVTPIKSVTLSHPRVSPPRYADTLVLYVFLWGHLDIAFFFFWDFYKAFVGTALLQSVPASLWVKVCHMAYFPSLYFPSFLLPWAPSQLSRQTHFQNQSTMQ